MKKNVNNDLNRIKSLMGLMSSNINENLIPQVTDQVIVDKFKFQQKRIIHLMNKLNKLNEEITLDDTEEIVTDVTGLDDIENNKGLSCNDLVNKINKIISYNPTITGIELESQLNKIGFSSSFIDSCEKMSNSVVLLYRSVGAGYEANDAMDIPGVKDPNKPKTISTWESKNGGVNMYKLFVNYLIIKAIKDAGGVFNLDGNDNEILDTFIDYNDQKYKTLVDKFGAVFTKTSVDISDTPYEGYFTNKPKTINFYKIPDTIKGWSGKDIIRCFEWMFDLNKPPKLPKSVWNNAQVSQECSCPPGFVDCKANLTHEFCKVSSHTNIRKTITCKNGKTLDCGGKKSFTTGDDIINPLKDVGEWYWENVREPLKKWLKKNLPAFYEWYTQTFRPFITGWGGALLSISLAVIGGILMATGVGAPLGAALFWIGFGIDMTEACIYILDKGDPFLAGVVFLFGILGLDTIKGTAKETTEKIMKEMVQESETEGVEQAEKTFVKKLSKEGVLETTQKIVTDPQNWKAAGLRIIKNSFKVIYKSAKWTIEKAAKLLLWCIKKGFLLSKWLLKTAFTMVWMGVKIAVPWGIVCHILGILPKEYEDMVISIKEGANMAYEMFQYYVLGKNPKTNAVELKPDDPFKGYIDDMVAYVLNSSINGNININNKKGVILGIQLILYYLGYNYSIVTPKPWDQETWSKLDKRFDIVSQSDFLVGLNYFNSFSLTNSTPVEFSKTMRGFRFFDEQDKKVFSLMLTYRPTDEKTPQAGRKFDISCISYDEKYDGVALNLSQIFDDLEWKQKGYSYGQSKQDENLTYYIMNMTPRDFMITLKNCKSVIENNLPKNYKGALSVENKLNELKSLWDLNKKKNKEDFEKLDLPPIAGKETMSDVLSGKIQTKELQLNEYKEGILDENTLGSIKYFKILNGLDSNSVLDEITLTSLLIGLNLNYGFDLTKLEGQESLKIRKNGKKTLKYDREKYGKMISDFVRDVKMENAELRQKLTIDDLIKGWENATDEERGITDTWSKEMNVLNTFTPEQIITTMESFQVVGIIDSTKIDLPKK